MAELLLRMLVRAGETVHNPFSMGHQYVRPQRGDAAKDLQRVTGDMRRVGADLKKTAQDELRRHGK